LEQECRRLRKAARSLLDHQRTVLKKLQHVQRHPYSTAIMLHDLIVQFLDIFQGDVLEALKSQAAAQVALYHRAITYIRKHRL